MFFFNKLATWLFLKRKPTEPDDHPDVNPLDLEELKKELRIEQEAKRQGEAGLPSPDATEYTGPELAIIQRLEATRCNYQRWAIVRLNAIHDRLTTFDITKVVNRAIQYGDEYERMANAKLSSAESELRRRKHTAERKHEDLQRFREENKLSRLANCPSLIHRIILILSALAIVFTEGCTNSSFFAQGLDGGLIQGFFYAFILASMNFGIAFILGRSGLPNIHHIRPFRRLIGYLSLLLALSIMVALGLVISHFRDGLSSSFDDDMNAVAAIALNSFTQSPLGLKDIMSWVLFILSMIFALGGLFEGYFWGDSYPGYQEKQNDFKRASEEYEELIDTLREELAVLKEEYLHNLERDVENAKINVVEFRSQVENKRALRLRLNQALSKAENMLTALVFYFRNENELHRQKLGLRRPAYFDTKPTFRELEFPNFNTKANEASLAEQEALLEELLDNVERIRAQIQSAYDIKFNQLKPIHQQFEVTDHG